MMESVNVLMSSMIRAFQHADAVFFIGFGLFFLAVWFLPSLLALAFNRKHLGKIALLNIPAGVSWVAWLALLVWAVTGKISNKLASKEHLKKVQ
ncbi:superinfection immunity protein [Pseudoalteromonas xiamenensis]|nr:superinfection immunity protein [Pseudoalteromonas xiamenensis]